MASLKGSIFFRIVSSLLISCILFMSVKISNVEALSCAEPDPPLKEMVYSEIVFKGKFVSSSKDKLHFKVQKLWKGQVGNNISLYENYWTEFIPGNEYIVFAGKDEGKLRPRLCGNTGVASPDLENQLGNIIPLTEQQPNPAPSWSSILFTIAGLIFIGILFYWFRKKYFK
ncbi:MAG: hypothetical protein ACK4M9_16705 [Anaerobacillus sp.]|uniref:hypothetical protein n=1 Tax=Anaerobacillus sp. TaxID=1872506 RepID=UPI00391ADBE7